MKYLVDIGRLVNVVATSPSDALDLARLATCCTDHRQMHLPFAPAKVYEQGTWRCWTEEEACAA